MCSGEHQPPLNPSVPAGLFVAPELLALLLAQALLPPLRPHLPESVTGEVNHQADCHYHKQPKEGITETANCYSTHATRCRCYL